MSEPIRIRARLKGGITEVVVLMPHPMETGLRVAPTGVAAPAHFITEVQVSVGQRNVLSARLGIAVSKDPLLTFRFRGGVAGERIRVTWKDNRGEQRSDEALIG